MFLYFVADNYHSDASMDSEKSDDESGREDNVDAVSEKNVLLKDQYKKYVDMLNVETDKLNRETDAVSALEKEKGELIYEIKHLIKRKEEVDRQNRIYEQMCADDGSEFEVRVKKMQSNLMDTLNAQKEKVHKYGELMKTAVGHDKMLDTYGLQPDMPELQRHLQETLAKLNAVLKEKVEKKAQEARAGARKQAPTASTSKD